jgi:hypothetical protein
VASWRDATDGDSRATPRVPGAGAVDPATADLFNQTILETEKQAWILEAETAPTGAGGP